VKHTVLVTCQNCDFDKQLAEIFAQEGHNVFTIKPGEDPQAVATQIEAQAGKLDFLLDTTDYLHKGDNFMIQTDTHGNCVASQATDNDCIANLVIEDDCMANSVIDNDCITNSVIDSGSLAQNIRDTIVDSVGIDAEIIEDVYRNNVLVSMRLLEKFLPLLDKGSGKRLFYVSSAKASIGETKLPNQYAYVMAKAALHQFIQMTRNKLAPSGYTFRIFDPLKGSLDPIKAAQSAYQYIMRRRTIENHNPLRDDEENIVMRDALGTLHGW